MAEIISLNRIRKSQNKVAAKDKAQENRAKFGRTKGEKAAERASADARERALDGHVLTREPE